MAENDATGIQKLLDNPNLTANLAGGTQQRETGRKKMLRRLTYYIGTRKHQTPEKEYPVLD